MENRHVPRGHGLVRLGLNWNDLGDKPEFVHLRGCETYSYLKVRKEGFTVLAVAFARMAAYHQRQRANGGG